MTHRIELELTDREVQQLRDVMDALPMKLFSTLILKATAALPMTDVTSPMSTALADVLRTRLPGSVA